MSTFVAYPGVPHWQPVFDVDFAAEASTAEFRVAGLASIAGYDWTTVGVGDGVNIRAIQNINGLGLTFQFAATNGAMNGCYGAIAANNNVQMSLPLPSISNLLTMRTPLRVRAQFAPLGDWKWYSDNSECGLNVALRYRRTAAYADLIGHYAQKIRHWTAGGGLVEWEQSQTQKLNAAESSHTYIANTTPNLIASGIAGFELPGGLEDSTYKMAYGNSAFAAPWVAEGSLVVPLTKYGTTYGSSYPPVASIPGYNSLANWALEISSEATFNFANSVKTHFIVLRALRIDAFV